VYGIQITVENVLNGHKSVYLNCNLDKVEE